MTAEEIARALPLLTASERTELDLLLLSGPKVFELASVLFGPQLAFAQDPAAFATAVCSRRAGKSVGVGAWLLEGPILKPKAPSLFLTKTRGNAKRIIWTTLLDLNRRYSLGFEANEAELVLKRDGAGAVYLAGLDNKSEIEKIRGTGWGRVAIDEAQSLPAYVKELVEDVLMPSLMDYGGQIRMIGTPAPVPVGFFYDATQSSEWTSHAWTVWENPHIPEARKRGMFETVLRTRGLTQEDPSIQREWFGRWTLDTNALVYRVDPSRNVYDALPMVREPWEYVIGVDLGFDDADAIVVLAFSAGSPAAYVVEEHVEAKQTITPLSEKLLELAERYEPLSIVVDTGGLGRKIVEEITARTGLPLKAAEKTRKFEFIELVNDALRAGRLFLPKGSRCGEDAMLVEWDRDRSSGDHKVISPRFHSDILDALTYTFRESLHWLHVPAVVLPEAGTPEWGAREENIMEEREEQEQREAKREAEEWAAW